MRRAVQVAPSSYLSSIAATVDLVSALLPTTHQSLPTPYSDVALTKWSQGHDGTAPAGAEAMKEKKWDDMVTSNRASTLLEDARSVNERARLLATMNKESGTWLQALPISAVGLRMDDVTIRTAVGLRPGTVICAHTLVNIVERKFQFLALMV